MLFWNRMTGEAVLAGVFTGLMSSIGNLYLLPEYFPILVWPISILVIVVVAVITDKQGSQIATVPEPQSRAQADD